MKQSHYIPIGSIAFAILIFVGVMVYIITYPTSTISTQPLPENDLYTIPTSTNVPGINNTNLTIPFGWSMDVFAKGLGNPRVLVKDLQGTLLTSITDQGIVVALPDHDGDGKADTTHVVARGLNHPHGLVFVCNPDCLLYITESHRVGEYTYDPTTFKASFRRTVAELPDGGRHITRTLVAVPNQFVTHLLVSVGSSCDACEEKDDRRASILDIDLTSLHPNTQPFAQGLRNAVFMAFHPTTGALWVTEMGRDFLGNDIPPDEINIVSKGNHYGWPYCYGNNVRDTQVGFSSIECKEPPYTPSLINIPAHSAPLGLAFVPPHSSGWPKEYWNNLFVAYHGSWNRDIPTGYKVVRYLFNDKSQFVGTQDMITGFLGADNTVQGRPAGILIDPDGVMYISDDTAGIIYRVSVKAPEKKENISSQPTIETPTSGQVVKSPLHIKGSAPSNWFFEGSFPVELKNEKGNIVVKKPIQAKGDWMTQGDVPFEVSLPFKINTKQKGTLILHNDNPSGLPENDKAIEVPIILTP